MAALSPPPGDECPLRDSEPLSPGAVVGPHGGCASTRGPDRCRRRVPPWHGPPTLEAVMDDSISRRSFSRLFTATSAAAIAPAVLIGDVAAAAQAMIGGAGDAGIPSPSTDG